MIVIAMQEERRLVKDCDGEVLVTGEGAVNVIRTLQNIKKETPIINIGYAGSNKIKKGTLVKIGKVKMYHPNTKFNEPTYNLDGDVLCYTAGDFVTEADIEEPCVFDMELAYILAMGFTNVTAYKVVSDCLCKKEFEETVDGVK